MTGVPMCNICQIAPCAPERKTGNGHKRHCGSAACIEATRLGQNFVSRTGWPHERVASDWYVDPAWCTELLLKHVDFVGPIWDPCCGQGTIPKAIAEHGDITNGYGGSDVVNRGYGEGERNFLTDPGPYYNLVFNPPYAIAEQFILHALDVACCKVAALVNLKFLASQGRRERLFKPRPPLGVLILSRRPSMPPGGSGIEAKGGTADYCWIVWENERERISDKHRSIIGWIA